MLRSFWMVSWFKRSGWRHNKDDAKGHDFIDLLSQDCYQISTHILRNEVISSVYESMKWKGSTALEKTTAFFSSEFII